MFTVVAAFAALCATAHAQDFEAEARRQMKLSFDMDEVDALLEAEPAAALSALGYVGGPYPPPYSVPALPLEPNSEALAVTVYRDRAVVSRSLSGEAGALLFEGLPLSLEPGSLNATVLQGEGRIVGVELLQGDAADEEARRDALREEIRPLAQELGEVQDRIEALLAQRSYLRSSLLGQRPGGAPQPSLNELTGMFDYIGKAEKQIAAGLREQTERAEELDEELSPLLVKVRNPQATGRRVRVEVEGKGKVEVGLSYQVTGAWWNAAYDARLEEGASHVSLEYVAVVTQYTGEDWDDVAVELSTADPATSGELPVLQPWYLGRDGYGSLDLDGGYATAPGAPAVGVPAGKGLVSSNMSAQVSGAGALVFSLPGRRTITGDGSPQRIPLGTQTFDAAIELATVPRLVPEVFRRARIVYAGEAPLLPGELSTYVSGDYVGGGQLQTVVPGEAVELAFGVDEGAQVERQLVSRRQESLGRRATRWTFHYRIVVRNFGDDVRMVQVMDQVPVAELDKVEVKLVEATGAADQGDGLLRWDLELAPGQARTIDLEFEVTAPANMPADVRHELEMMMM